MSWPLIKAVKQINQLFHPLVGVAVIAAVAPRRNRFRRITAKKSIRLLIECNHVLVNPLFAFASLEKWQHAIPHRPAASRSKSCRSMDQVPQASPLDVVPLLQI